MKPERELLQNPYEWWTYLEFVKAYFKNRGIENPVVVELGVYTNVQREFYERELGASYIGIDSQKWLEDPDVLGDTRNPATVVKLREVLAGRSINLLFIDADHRYESARIEYEFYGPMVKNIIAFHDVCEPQLGVCRLWNELFEEVSPWTKVVFFRHGSAIAFRYGQVTMLVPRMGIGLLIKEGLSRIQ